MSPSPFSSRARQSSTAGFSLHEESFVVESYSLGLMAPVDGDVLAAKIEAGATDLELRALSEDMRMARRYRRETYGVEVP